MLEGLRDRAKKAERIAEIEEELRLPPFPVAATHIWAAFIRLHNRRGSNGFGPSPILWSDIESFMRLSGVHLAPWEVEAVEDLDCAFLIEQAKSVKKP